MAPVCQIRRRRHRTKLFILISCLIFMCNIAIVAAVEGCTKPKCFYYRMRNVTMETRVNFKDGDIPDTVFCFEGLERSPVYLWANPVLKVRRKNATTPENLRFTSFYGTSVADVESRSRQMGYAMLQNWASAMRTAKQTEDLSMDPFSLSCYMISTNIDYTATVRVKSPELWYVSYLILGIVVFFSAKSWSHNASLHYGTGVSVGVVASVLIMFFVISRLMPRKLKFLGYGLMLFGGSVSLWLLTTITGIFSEQATNTLVEYWQYFLGYIVIVGLLSFAVVYRSGPVTDERTLSLIQWFLQGIALGLVYMSTQIPEISVALILVLLAIYNFPKKIFVNSRSKSLWYRFFPPKIRLLTQEEYYQQGVTETAKELEKLREYCRSPQCQTWKVISKLKSPQRFAEFINQGAWHISATEIMDYEARDFDLPSDDVPADTESELVFVLGSPSRTVAI